MITLVFTTTNSWLSKLIRFFTKGRSSHVMVGIKVYDQDMFLHCTSGGVQVTPREKWLKGSTLVAEYEIVPDVTSGVKQAFRLLNDNYDYPALLGYAWLLVMWRLFKKKVKNPLASTTSYVCSEFVCHLDLTGACIKEWSNLDPERTHPEDLLVICENSENFKKVN